MQDNVSAEDGASPNAISLFGQAANANDFPVLKAFQEYIDAEQAKARKRMLGLSIFFVVLLVAVVITFTIIVISIFTHNRELSDRLLDVAFRERERLNQVVAQQQAVPQPIVQPVVTPVVAPAQDAGIKPILEKLDALATALASRQQQTLQPAPVVVTTAPATVAPSAPADNAEARQMRDTIKKQQAELEAERNRLKEAEEKLRQAEIERHRRRLYPEYYAQKDLETAAASRQEPVEKPVVPPTPAPVPAAVPPPPKPTTALKNLKPIDYFSQGDDDDLAELAKSKKKQTAQPVAKTEATVPAKQVVPPPAPAKVQPAKPIVPAKPAASPSPKKPEPKPEPAKAQKKPSQKALQPSVPKTETLDVSTSSDNTIPWLIEERDL